MPPTNDETGRVVAEKYRLRRIIGEGGMGVVYAATHLWTDREVAVKVLHPYYARDETTVHRFMREARAAARLHHPHVVDVLDMGQREDGSVYMVMEMLVGETLAERLRREGALDPTTVLSCLLPIMDALAVAHDRGIVHRDLKPDNIFLSHDGHGKLVPKLLDFGIAKMQAQGGRETEAGSIIGTPAYMSPEQIRGVDVGPRADVWSLGVVLYEALSGRLPFSGETPTSVLAAILTEDVPPLRVSAPAVPEPFTAVIQRALQKEAALRPETMRTLEEVLLAAATEAGVPFEGRISRIAWDPSMAEPTATDSIGKGMTTAVTRSLAPIASGALWAGGALAVVALAMGVGLYVGLQRPWNEPAPAAPGNPTAAPPPSEVAARPPVEAPGEAPRTPLAGVAAPDAGPPTTHAPVQTAQPAQPTEPAQVAHGVPRPAPRGESARARRTDAPAVPMPVAAPPVPVPAPAEAPAAEPAAAPTRRPPAGDDLVEDELLRPRRWGADGEG